MRQYLVAATSVGARAVVIELVGIAADRRAVATGDPAGMISRVAIDSATSPRGSVVTRVHVFLDRPYRHRLRLSDRLVYVDFELAEPLPRNPASSTLKLASTAKPARTTATPVAAGSGNARVAAPTAVPTAGVAPVVVPPPAPLEVNVLSRWVAIRENLQSDAPAVLDPKAMAKPWMPLILQDGTTLFSYGDHVKVNEEIAFMLPVDDSDSPRVAAVALRASSVDLESTTRAGDAVRALRYAATRGPAEFDALLEEVSVALTAVPSDPDPLGRVVRVEQARRRLLEWPDSHYGYRATDVHEAARALDPVLNQLRSVAGVPRVDLTLSASAPAAVPARPYRIPTLLDLLENAFRVVLLLTPPQRTTVLQAAAESLQRHKEQLPPVWLSTGQRHVSEALKSEARLDDAYGRLSRDIATRAIRAASKGDVRAIAELQDQLVERDRELGGLRPDIVASAMAILKTHSDLAVIERLRRDREAMGANPR